MKSITILLFLILQLLCVTAAPTSLLKPSQDSWYNLPKNFEDAQPGDILKWRKTPAPIDSPFFTLNIRNSWQQMVRSTDSLGNPTVAVSTIIQPYNADPSTLVSYNPIEDAVNIDCSPSYAYLDGADNSTATTQSEMYIIQLVLNQGWNVIVPDWEGPKSAYVAAELSAYQTLDLIRGALQTKNITEINSGAKVAMWGYSGGTIGPLWASALQSRYAPDLNDNFIGVAVGGTVTNVTDTAVLLDGNASAGQVAAALGGAGEQYPSFKTQLFKSMNPDKVDKFNKIYKTCLDDSHEVFLNDNFFSGEDKYFPEGWEFLQIPAIRDVLDANTLAINKSDDIPQFPIFFYHGQKDITVHIDTVERVFNNWCSWTDTPIGNKDNTTYTTKKRGLSLEFAIDQNNDHYQQAKQGIPAAFAWLDKRFKGEPHVDGCSRIERKSNLLYPGVAKGVIEFVEAAAKTLVGARIGPTNSIFDLFANGMENLPELNLDLDLNLDLNISL